MHRNRASIAGMMGIVVVAAVSLAALRSASPVWASLAFLLTCGVLAFAWVGALCGAREQRAWWVGCAVFGGGYLALTTWSSDSPLFLNRRLPTIQVLSGILTYLGAHPLPREDPQGGFVDLGGYEDLLNVEHCLWSLVFALLGGIVASRLIAVPTGPPGRAENAPTRTRPPAPFWRRGTTLLALAGLAIFLVSGIAWSRTAPGLWAGLTRLMTWALIAFLALGAAFRTGPSRPRWLGAAVFGAGYLWLVPGSDPDPTWPQCATTSLIYEVKPWVPWISTDHPSTSPTIAELNTRIVRTLNRRIPMRFPNDTPLETFLADVKDATRDADGWTVPIHVDPVGLQEAEKTLQSTVTLDLEGAPLRTSLELALRQLGLVAVVQKGVLQITFESSGTFEDDRIYTEPIIVLGQSVLTWLAAGLGALLAPLACGNDRQTRA